jgi:hypothetical protein
MISVTTWYEAVVHEASHAIGAAQYGFRVDRLAVFLRADGELSGATHARPPLGYPPMAHAVFALIGPVAHSRVSGIPLERLAATTCISDVVDALDEMAKLGQRRANGWPACTSRWYSRDGSVM